MGTVYIDGQAYEVDSSKNLLDVCLSLGMDLPYFCWHPAMGSVGACRQCAVKQFRDEADTKGQLVMACMTPAADGTRISLKDEEAEEFRESVIEWLMVNHPHDCPICDEGGECHLQDMTVMTGHSYRRFRFRKRTYLNQYLGPFINHEMNRCIQCYRCVRFYRDYADGRDFDVFGAHDDVYFGRHEDGVLQSEFSGNLVEVCPTGVFTDKTLKKHYTRKWDLQTAPSVCTLCSVGCNIIPGERYRHLRRVRARYNYDVNGYFICDRGRYGYEFVNSLQRIRYPRLRDQERAGQEAPDEVQPSSDDALARLSELLAGSQGVVGIGSPRASLEANFALHQLVGREHFCSGVNTSEQQLVQRARDILQAGPARSASLRDIAEADAVLVLGEDLTNTAPMMAYAVRQALRNQPWREAQEVGIAAWNDYAIREIIQEDRGPLFLATGAGTKLEDVATFVYHATPADQARLGRAVAHLLDAGAPAVPDLDESVLKLAQRIAEALQQAQQPVVISGVSGGSAAVMDAAAAVAAALGDEEQPGLLGLVVPEANSMGLALLEGMDLQAARRALQEGAADTLVIVENDLFRRAEAPFVEELLQAARQVIVLDYLETETTARADVVLPAATFAEGDGTLVNYEGRAQRFLQVFVPEGEVQESWRWLQALNKMVQQGAVSAWRELDDVLQAMAHAFPGLAAVEDVTPPSEFRIVDQKIPRQPHRYSGRTAMNAHINVSEPKPPDDEDTPLHFSMEGYKGQPPAELVPRFWAPGWNSIQALNKFQIEVGGPLRGGRPGRRLIEPGNGQSKGHGAQIPDAFQPRSGEWLALPLYHIYGSDPLSMLTPGVAELAPAPYVALHAEDAAALGVQDGQALAVQVAHTTLRLPVRIMTSLPRGVLGLPSGLPQMPYLSLPGWVQVEAVTEEES